MLRTDQHPNNNAGDGSMIYNDQGGGLIIGGPYRKGDDHDNLNDAVQVLSETVYMDDDNSNRKIQIIKTGNHAKQAALIDLEFDFEVASDSGRAASASKNLKPKLRNVTTQFIELESSYRDSFVIKSMIDKQLQVVQNLENEVIVNVNYMGNGETETEPIKLSSRSSRGEQTTVGALVCNAIKEEMQTDAAILNGGAMHGDTTYPNNTMTYAQLKRELVAPPTTITPHDQDPATASTTPPPPPTTTTTTMIVVPMTRLELYKAITYAQMNLSQEPNGFLQTNSNLSLAYPSSNPDQLIQVAVPHNLLLSLSSDDDEDSSNCKILPLMQLGKTLQEENTLPALEDGTPLLDLVTRNCCKNRWVDILHNTNKNSANTRALLFEDIDLNHDGVLDKDEIALLMTKVLGYKPQEYVIDDMIQSIDHDGNGVIDEDEFNVVLARLERHKNQEK